MKTLNLRSNGAVEVPLTVSLNLSVRQVSRPTLSLMNMLMQKGDSEMVDFDSDTRQWVFDVVLSSQASWLSRVAPTILITPTDWYSLQLKMMMLSGQMRIQGVNSLLTCIIGLYKPYYYHFIIEQTNHNSFLTLFPLLLVIVLNGVKSRVLPSTVVEEKLTLLGHKNW